MTVNGPGADPKELGNFFVRVTFAYKSHDFMLARREIAMLLQGLATRKGGGRLFKIAPDARCNLLAAWLGCFGYGRNRVEEAGRRSAPEEVPAGASGGGLE